MDRILGQTSGTVRPAQRRGQIRSGTAAGPIAPASLLESRFDFTESSPLRRSYIVAATPMSGNTFLCTRLWQTGVMGAPAEYFSHVPRMQTKIMQRLNVSSTADLLAKLIASRTSPNGIFGMSLNFTQFEELQRAAPDFLSMLAPTTFIHLERTDQMVQAAFMARVVQRDTMLAEQSSARRGYRYDRDLILKWLGRIERQRLGWIRWFAANKIEPYVVSYDRMLLDAATVVKAVGAENDHNPPIAVPLANAPDDETSKDWAARLIREIERGVERPQPDRAAKPVLPKPVARSAPPFARARPAAASTGDARPPREHAFDRFDQARDAAVRPVAAMRLRHRHKAIVLSNNQIFRRAKVLDLRSGDGRWSWAALDAGAAHVTGLESKQKPIAAARDFFAKLQIDPASYEFLHARILQSLRTFEPEAFDVILCKEFYQEPYAFFSSLRRLRPKNVVLDTALARGRAPFAVFKAKRNNNNPQESEGQSGLSAVPTEQTIRLFADFFGFQCRAVDWRTLGIADWTGIHDYERGIRGTYLLERIAGTGQRTALAAKRPRAST
jgi:LPS sulfotransferase NodH/SAM-dependent methyltransferase